MYGMDFDGFGSRYAGRSEYRCDEKSIWEISEQIWNCEAEEKIKRKLMRAEKTREREKKAEKRGKKRLTRRLKSVIM